MALFELKSMSGTVTLKNAAEDYRNAKRVAQYRVGEQAVYFPAFPGTRYVPYAAVTKAFARNSSLPIKGTCGKAIPVVKVRLFYDGEEFYQEFLAETHQQANTILDAVEAARPEIPIEREKRKFEVF